MVGRDGWNGTEESIEGEERKGGEGRSSLDRPKMDGFG